MENIRFYMKDFCEKTGIHGFQYIGESRTLFEKILWLFCVLISILASAFFISELDEKRLNSPVIVTFSNKPRSLVEIPFPAVTICPEAKVNPNFVDLHEFKRKMLSGDVNDLLNDNEKRLMNSIIGICLDPSISDFESYKFKSLSKLQNEITNISELFYAFDEIRPDFTIDKCTFKSEDLPCNLLFVPIITSEGFCYSFNILRRSEMFTDIVPRYSNYQEHNVSSEFWNYENGYLNTDIKAAVERGITPNVFPVRAALSLKVEDFQITLKIDKNATRNCCKASSQGYKISIHTPVDFPNLQRNYFRIPYSSDVVASTEPQPMTTSESSRRYHPLLRNCYFQSESKLRFFKVYTRENCKLECLANDTLRLCGCVDFYMPRDNVTRVCSLNATSCMKEAEWLNRFLYHTGDLQTPEVNTGDCFLCLLPCNEINYKVSISHTSTCNEYSSGNRDDTRNDYDYARLSVFFPSDDFIGTERNQLYGGTVFVANVGGVLGLFTGFSMMSIVEVIYFLSFRFICNMKLYKNWAGRRRTHEIDIIKYVKTNSE